MSAKTPKGKVGIVVGGGPAPGINGVIAGATVEALRNGHEVVGFLDGFKWLAKGDTTHTVEMTAELAEQIRLKGGSFLRTSRENPTKDPAKLANVLEAIKALDIQYLVTIGGDDTAFSARRVSEEANGKVLVAHVPKTIDNDLPLPMNMPTFGYNTARYFGSLLVKNLAEDAKTTTRWYVVVAMGRTAGHLAQGMGSVGGAMLTIIPEEFDGRKVTMEGVVDELEAAMLKGKALKHDYGVAVVAEGVADLMKDDLAKEPLVQVEYDEHGHIRLAEVPFALILKRRLQDRAKARGQKVTVVDVTVGYELRCADPVPFDVEYVQQLGWGAVRYLLGIGEGGFTTAGAMMSVQAGEVVPIPFADIVDPVTGKTQVRRVNVNLDTYRSARAAMLRLERSDIEDAKRLEALAGAAGITADEFKAKYGPVVGL